MQRKLTEHKEQSNTVKSQLQDYSKKAQEKLGEFRKEKKEWMVDEAKMRAADKEAKVRSTFVDSRVNVTKPTLQETFAAQGKQLAEALQRVFQLETKIRENAPKVDRLHDYEKQIDQLIMLQRLWYVRVQAM